MRLVSVYDFPKEDRLDHLYRLLSERTPAQSISHKAMPTLAQHEQFVESHPYPVWYFICADEDYSIVYGSVYLTSNREIGISVYDEWRNQGIGTLALKELFEIHKGPFYANINPGNQDSIDFFEKQGFRHIQQTYKLEAT